MRRAFAGVAAVVVVSAPLATGQAQESLPVCPNRAEVVWTYPPDYLRVGESLSFSFERYRANVASVDVDYPTRDGAATETFEFGNRDSVRVIRPAPGEPRRFGMAFRWVQNAGRENACRGTDRYRGIPIVPRDARVGNPSAPRFAGRYRVRYSDGNKSRWRLRPRCDYFGCITKLRSSGGLRAKFRPRRRDRYKLFSKQYAGYCEVTYITGTTRRFNMYADIRVTLKVTRERGRDGVATRLRGVHRTHEYAAGQGYDICDQDRDKRRVRVVRR